MTERRSTWPPARRRLAVVAIGTAFVTALLAAFVGGTADHVYGAVAYAAIALAALRSPTWITVQVIGGQIIAANLLLSGASPGLAVVTVALAVMTAELLAAVGRLDSPLDREAGGYRRTLTASLIAAAVCSAVLPVAGLPGPSGLLAIGLAASACVVLAIVMVRGVRQD